MDKAAEPCASPGVREHEVEIKYTLKPNYLCNVERNTDKAAASRLSLGTGRSPWAGETRGFTEGLIGGRSQALPSSRIEGGCSWGCHLLPVGWEEA